jgi:hypothetical protein
MRVVEIYIFLTALSAALVLGIGPSIASQDLIRALLAAGLLCAASGVHQLVSPRLSRLSRL